MTDIVGPFDNSTWSQTEWARHMLGAMPSGVIDVPAASPSTGGLALLTSGLNVGLDQGRANVGAFGFYRTGVQTANMAVTANTNASLFRRDRLVLRRDLGANTITPVRIQGVAAANPIAPVVTQNTTVWDLRLFSFLVPPNSATNLSGIIDEREWLNADANVGLLGHAAVGGAGVGITLGTSNSTTPVELDAPDFRFTCYLRPGRAYKYTAALRMWSTVTDDVGSAAARIIVGTPAASNPQITGDVATAETTGIGHLYPLRPQKVFQVATAGNYTFSLWGNRVNGTGTVTFLHTSDGQATHQVEDVGPALASVPFPF